MGKTNNVALWFLLILAIQVGESPFMTRIGPFDSKMECEQVMANIKEMVTPLKFSRPTSFQAVCAEGLTGI